MSTPLNPVEIVRQRQRELANAKQEEEDRKQQIEDRKRGLMKPLLDFLRPLLLMNSKTLKQGLLDVPMLYPKHFGRIGHECIEVMNPTRWNLQPDNLGLSLLITTGDVGVSQCISTTDAEAMLIEHAANFCELPPPPPPTRTMTFEEWRATGKDTPRLGDVVETGHGPCNDSPGRVYHGGLWLAGPMLDGNYFTHIERDEFSGRLDIIEMKLYDWARGAIDMEVPA